MDYKLFDAEYKFISLIWEHEPLSSGDLVRLCTQKLGWKKSTTYTVLRKLSERGMLQNDNSTVSSLVSKREVQRYESENIVDRSFGGSLPAFVAAFLADKKLSPADAEALRHMIEEAKHG